LGGSTLGAWDRRCLTPTVVCTTSGGVPPGCREWVPPCEQSLLPLLVSFGGALWTFVKVELPVRVNGDGFCLPTWQPVVPVSCESNPFVLTSDFSSFPSRFFFVLQIFRGEGPIFFFPCQLRRYPPFRPTPLHLKLFLTLVEAWIFFSRWKVPPTMHRHLLPGKTALRRGDTA